MANSEQRGGAPELSPIERIERGAEEGHKQYDPEDRRRRTAESKEMAEDLWALFGEASRLEALTRFAERNPSLDISREILKVFKETKERIDTGRDKRFHDKKNKHEINVWDIERLFAELVIFLGATKLNEKQGRGYYQLKNVGPLLDPHRRAMPPREIGDPRPGIEHDFRENKERFWKAGWEEL